MNKLDLITQLINSHEKIDISISRSMQNYSQKFGFVSLQHFEALMLLHDYARLKMSELASKMNLRTSGATQLINILVNQEQVERILDSSDRRIIYIQLSPKWKLNMNQMKKQYNQILTELFSQLDEQELETLISIIQKITIKD